MMELADVPDSKDVNFRYLPRESMTWNRLKHRAISTVRRGSPFLGVPPSLTAQREENQNAFSHPKSTYAGVVELADALDSKSSVRKDVRVRPPPPAPSRRKLHIACDDFFASRQRSSRAHSAAPPFPTRSASPGLCGGPDLSRKPCSMGAFGIFIFHSGDEL